MGEGYDGVYGSLDRHSREIILLSKGLSNTYNLKPL